MLNQFQIPFNPFRVDEPMEMYIFTHTDFGSKIATARETINALQCNHALSLQDWYIGEALKMAVTIERTTGPQVVKARILYGRWMVDCPRCNGANDVIPGEPIYLCSCCMWPGVFRPGSEYVAPHFAEVIFPENREAIEAILLKRPAIANRNWYPGESIEQLEKENSQLGCEV